MSEENKDTVPTNEETAPQDEKSAETEKMLAMPFSQLQAIADYLTSRPYREVAHLVEMLKYARDV